MKDNPLSIAVMFDRESLRIPELLKAASEALRNLAGAKWAAISPAFWTATAQRVPEYVEKLTDVSVTDVLTEAWKINRQFVKYTDTKQYPPGKESIVELYTHHIKSSYEPYLKVTMDGVETGRLEFALELDVALKAGNLVIRNGRFMRIEPGGCEVTGTLSLQKVQVSEKKIREFPWPAIPLGKGGEGIEIDKVV
jgi:hypothetical protein